MSLPQQQKRLGSSGMELLLELKRGSGGDGTSSSIDSKNQVLPAYNDTLVQTCLEELNGHLQALEDQVQAVTGGNNSQDSSKMPMSSRPAMILENTAVQRHKRCLLTYHHVRMQAMQSTYWQSGADMSTSGENLAPLEHEFYQDYHKLIQKYSNAVDAELSTLLTPPLPQDRVQVRVVRDDVFGGASIALESGAAVTFTKGSTHYLPYSDVEEYLQQGYLQLLDGEEQEL